MKVVLQHISKHFPNRDKNINEDVIAVNDFNFEIPDGKLVALLGPSGCGKSTILKMISGLDKPTKGKIFFGDDDVTDIPAETRGVGLVFQNYALYPHLTVEKNIMFPLKNLKGKNKLSKKEMTERTEKIAKLVQLDGLLKRLPKELSGGQQQRVAIARALVKTPKVLLLDEPLSNLDARLRLQTREEIRRIQQETGVTTVFVTHDQDEAMSIADYIVLMKDGIFQQMNRPQNVYDDPQNLFVAKFLGTPPINVFDAEIKDGYLNINGTGIKKINCSYSGKVYMAVRPEGLIPKADGTLICRFERVEVMGRDTSVIAAHDCSHNEKIRAVLPSEICKDLCGDTVNFDVRYNKTFLFEAENEKRIPYEFC